MYNLKMYKTMISNNVKCTINSSSCCSFFHLDKIKDNLYFHHHQLNQTINDKKFIKKNRVIETFYSSGNNEREVFIYHYLITLTTFYKRNLSEITSICSHIK